MTNAALYTDFYQLSMMNTHFRNKSHEKKAVFQYFYRKAPFGDTHIIFAGLHDLLPKLRDIKFTKEDVFFLDKERIFRDDFLEYLYSFKLKATIKSMREGTLVPPNCPILQVEGTIAECHLIESFLLNYLNFQSLIATKTRRIVNAAGPFASVAEFGLRRAQGEGSIQASRAAYIGGANSTSNVLAAKIHNIPLSGTMAHAWVQSFDNEYDAFKTYAKHNGSRSVFLLDTYNTIKSGLPNVLKLKEDGYSIHGVRLDSGDLYELSKKVRAILDDNGLSNTKIYATDSLDEYSIAELQRKKAPISAFGVGTNLIVSKEEPALGGVYKMAMFDGKGRLKMSENPEKSTYPLSKEVDLRLNPNMLQITHCVREQNQEVIEGYEKLYKLYMKNGELVKRNLDDITYIKAYIDEQYQKYACYLNDEGNLDFNVFYTEKLKEAKKNFVS